MQILALRGKENTGKSKTLKLLIQMVTDISDQVYCGGFLPPKAIEDTEKDSKDIPNQATDFAGDVYAVFSVNGLCVGIVTQGDARSYLASAYTTTAKAAPEQKLDVFICAVRSYGATNSYLSEICPGSFIWFYEKAGIETIGDEDDSELEKLQDKLNKIQAQIIFEHLCEIISYAGTYGNNECN